MDIRLATIEQDYWELRSAEKSQQNFPETFIIPDIQQRASLNVGDAAKLIFDIKYLEDGHYEVQGERMYVIVSRVIEDVYIGILDSQPSNLNPDDNCYLTFGVEIPFKAEHIIEIDRPPESYIKWQLNQAPEKVWI